MQTSTSLAIDVHGLTKRYGGRNVVDAISLRWKRGASSVSRPNGSGKTTTIRMICGLLTPDAGRVSCLGLDIMTDAIAIKREVGYMTQKFRPV
jgi:ABC-2 type transport system ATP-binding protein